MATWTVGRTGLGIARGSQGSATGDGTAAVVTLGFKPKRVVLINLTDTIKFEKVDGMSDAQTLKTVAAGTMTTDATSAIVLTASGFTVAAAANINAKAFVWYAA